MTPLDALALAFGTFYCAALWAALALYAALLIAPPVVCVFAAAGVASFAYRWTGADHA